MENSKKAETILENLKKLIGQKMTLEDADNEMIDDSQDYSCCGTSDDGIFACGDPDNLTNNLDDLKQDEKVHFSWVYEYVLEKDNCGNVEDTAQYLMEGKFVDLAAAKTAFKNYYETNNKDEIKELEVIITDIYNY